MYTCIHGSIIYINIPYHCIYCSCKEIIIILAYNLLVGLLLNYSSVILAAAFSISSPSMMILPLVEHCFICLISSSYFVELLILLCSGSMLNCDLLSSGCLQSDQLTNSVRNLSFQPIYLHIQHIYLSKPKFKLNL